MSKLCKIQICLFWRFATAGASLQLALTLASASNRHEGANGRMLRGRVLPDWPVSREIAVGAEWTKKILHDVQNLTPMGELLTSLLACRAIIAFHSVSIRVI